MTPYLGLRGQKMTMGRVILVVLPAFLLFGYNQSQIGGVLRFSSFTRTFPEIDTSTTTGATKAYNATIQGTVVAIYTIGCLFGALSCTFAGNRLGRRKTLLIYACVAIIGHVLQASSFDLVQLIIGRIVTGVGVGVINAVVPVWQAECSRPKNRGKNVVVVGLFIASGQALASWINYGLGTIEDDQVAWRLPLAMPILFLLMLCASVFIFPESPRWLVQKGRIAEAVEAKSVLDDAPPDSNSVQVEISAMELAAEEGKRKSGWKDIIASGPQRLFYRACLAFAVNFNAQMTGANAISYYATTIFKESLLFPSREASALAAGLLTWKIFSSSISLFTVDRFGRKPLFMTSGAGMSVSMTCLAITVSMIEKPAAGKAATFFLFLYMSFFPIGFLGANFLYSTEIAPQDLRVHFSAIGTATHWLFNFVIAEITPICFAHIGYRTYIIYAIISAFAVPLVYLTFPETNGRSLEEMNLIFSASKHWWQVPSAERRTPPSIIAQIEDGKDEDLANGKLREEEVQHVEHKV